MKRGVQRKWNVGRGPPQGDKLLLRNEVNDRQKILNDVAKKKSGRWAYSGERQP